MPVVRKKIRVQGQNNFIPLPEGEFSSPIQLDPDNMYPFSFIYNVDEFGTPLTGSNLADISTIDNVDGIPQGIPANDGLAIVQWGYYDMAWYNVIDFKLWIDLGGSHDLDYCYVWLPEIQNQGLAVYASRNGTDLELISDGTIYDLGQNEWIKIDFQGAARGGARYIVIGLGYAETYLNAFVLYGRPKGLVVNKGLKKRRNIGKRPLDRVLGTNGFYFDDVELMGPVSGVSRWYVLPDWIWGEPFRATGSAIGKTVDEITFRFDNSHMGSVDQQLQGFKNTKTNSMFTFTQSPVALRPIGTVDAYYSKPIDPGFSTTNLAHTTNPVNVKYMSRLIYNMAARYGFNVNVDQQYIQLDDTVGVQPIRMGLGIMEAIEPGNEFDAWWHGAQGYFNPEEMAAMMSGLYDGHKGLMGPGFGMKAADPSMKMSMPAVALSDNFTYVQRMFWWWDENRGKGDYPMNIINFHYYNGSAGSQLITEGTSYGLQPEKGNYLNICRQWSDFRNTHSPSMEVWLTETGYDEHLGGVYSPYKVTQFERSRCKAYWLPRLFIVGQIGGMDVIQHYWFANHGGPKFTDLPENEPNSGAFLSSGLVDGVQNSEDWHRTPLMSYWYVAQFRHTLTGYTFQHAIMMDGVSNVEETIIEGTTATVWAAAYKNYLTGEGIIAIWLSSSDFLSANVTVAIPEATAEVVNIDEGEIRKSLEGVTSVKTASAGKITLTVTECVQFIRTTNLGTEKLIEPVKIRTQILNEQDTLITWVDNNTQDVAVSITRSATVDGTYTEIYEGVRNNASYIDAGTGNTAYFYKVTAVRI